LNLADRVFVDIGGIRRNLGFNLEFVSWLKGHIGVKEVALVDADFVKGLVEGSSDNVAFTDQRLSFVLEHFSL
jgi:hypothetical protein